MPVYNDIPTIDYYPSPEKVMRRIYEPLRIQSILDVGAGHGGVFDQGYWDEMPMQWKEACDIFWVKPLPMDWKVKTPVDVCELNKTYRAKSFDMVQCMEVLEHVHDPKLALQQLCEVARKFVMISSADEMHHVGAEQERVEKINPAQRYVLQPKIADLKALGFEVRVTSYNRRQIVAWKVM